MPINIIKKLTLQSTPEDYTEVAQMLPGALFKIEEDAYEQIMLNMQEKYPEFEAVYVHPGTDLFTLMGSGTMVVTSSGVQTE